MGPPPGAARAPEQAAVWPSPGGPLPQPDHVLSRSGYVPPKATSPDQEWLTEMSNALDERSQVISQLARPLRSPSDRSISHLPGVGCTPHTPCAFPCCMSDHAMLYGDAPCTWLHAARVHHTCRVYRWAVATPRGCSSKALHPSDSSPRWRPRPQAAPRCSRCARETIHTTRSTKRSCRRGAMRCKMLMHGGWTRDVHTMYGYTSVHR